MKWAATGGRAARSALLIAVLAGSVQPARATASSPAARAARLTRVFGLSAHDRAPGSLQFSLAARGAGGGVGRFTVSAWLTRTAGGRRIPLSLNRATLRSGSGRRTRTFELTARLPAIAASGSYRLLVCATKHRQAPTPPSRGCVRSRVLSITAGAVPITITLGRSPLTVSPTLDSSRAVSQTVDSSGGTLATTAADGSKIVLTIPANALAGAEQITMTPIQSLGGSPVSLIAGVQLDPAGLLPLQPLTLSVTPARSVPLGQQVAFAYQAGGSQFGLVPLASQSSIAIPVAQFGGLGFGQASAAQLAGQRARAPSDPEAAFLQQLALDEYPVRTQQLSGHLAHAAAAAPALDLSHIEGDLAGFYNQYVQPSLASAGDSLFAFQLVAGYAFSWERQVELLGLHDEFAAQEQQINHALIDVAMPALWNQAVAKCTGGIESITGLRSAIAIGRTAELLGGADLLGGEQAINDAIFNKCKINLQVSLQSTTTTWTADPQTAADFPISSVQVDSNAGPVALQQQPSSGSAPTNVLTFQTPNVTVDETIMDYTVGSSIGSFCSVSPPVVSTDLGSTYVSFKAILTVPADLFAKATIPPSTLDVTTSGADKVSSTLNCNSVSTTYTVPTQAMGTVAYITQAKPVRLTDTQPSGTFNGSFFNPDGALLGTFTGTGTITAQIPQ